MAKSSVYPSLERKLGPNDNWIEQVGGLPQYIERIAKHLHYEKGFTISHAIATAVNTVKRWARKGTVVKYNDPKNNRVLTITAAQAAADVASWEAKKARYKAMKKISLSVPAKELTAEKRRRRAAQGQAMSDGSYPIFDKTSLQSAIRLAGRSKKHSKEEVMAHIRRRAQALGLTSMLPGTGAGRGRRGRLSLSSVSRPEVDVDLQALAVRANAIADPACRGHARVQVLDLAMTKDGRRSYKKQGKWKHGFIPVDESATTSKAKGSPIAKRRIKRLYGNPAKASSASAAAEKRTLEARARKSEEHGGKIRSNTGRQGARKGGPQERVQRVGQSLHADIRPSTKSQRAKISTMKEVGKGRRAAPRAGKPWESIPDSEKMVRNGKRYVVTYFHGQRLVTEWIGSISPVKTPGAEGRKFGTVTTATLSQMSTADLRKLLRSGKNDKATRAKIRKVMDAKLAKAAKKA